MGTGPVLGANVRNDHKQVDRRQTLYELLQVTPHASPDVIHAAYRVLARTYHPDRNGDTSAVNAMRELNMAYEVLSDPTRRARYDAHMSRSGRLPGGHLPATRNAPVVRIASRGAVANSSPMRSSSSPHIRGFLAAFVILVIVVLVATVLFQAYEAIDDASPFSGGPSLLVLLRGPALPTLNVW
jgi:hypothetical protein